MTAYAWFTAFVLLVALGGFVLAGYDLLAGWLASGADVLEEVGR